MWLKKLICKICGHDYEIEVRSSSHLALVSKLCLRCGHTTEEMIVDEYNNDTI